jgi:hypothetical protein
MRYRREMKKSTVKLVVNRETLRTLATRELTHAVGGVFDATDSCRTVCPSATAVVVNPRLGG